MKYSLITRLAFFVSMLILPSGLCAQELNIAFDMGVGTYRMSDLMQLNRNVMKSLPFDAKLTDDFPGYWDYKPSLMFSFRKLAEIGITSGLQSTGSRISCADYSGEYSFDTRIRCTSYGIIIGIHSSIGKFRASIRNESGIENSSLAVEEYLRIESESERDDFTYKSKNYYSEPSVKISYPVRFFRAGITAGYHFDFIMKELKDGGNGILLADGKFAEADWSGARISASISFNILQKFRTPKNE
jgi:hypothetical protein